MVMSVTWKNQFTEDDLEGPVFCFFHLRCMILVKLKKICNQTERMK